jgi:hypothetical protein
MPLLWQAQGSSGWNATAATVCDAFAVLTRCLFFSFFLVGKLGWIKFVGEFRSW